MTINTRHLRELIHRARPLPLVLATRNSWCQIVAADHTLVCTPCIQPDGHPDLLFAGGAEGPNAMLMIEAVNALPELLDALAEASARAFQADMVAEAAVEDNKRLRAALAGMIGYSEQSCGVADDPDFPEYQAALRAMEAKSA
ncbi:MAG: hypothetical protein EPN31_05875 [Castellaniella sp.]|uniref:hypothetical protein n=1 Tax=Castellaniella sp. TaxID=1955812 RepID=UPI0011FF6AF2|nr:hypothetical protein [Castellaniella sp.]TAN29758.1 MAG: hypothetical protein EPN31_05875 [Castellaniella sp.]